jgi:hypothetical protein
MNQSTREVGGHGVSLSPIAETYVAKAYAAPSSNSSWKKDLSLASPII